MIGWSRWLAAMGALVVIASVVGCGRESGGGGDAAGMNDHAHEENAPTNRIDIPAAVRQNLGMTFVKVEARRVEHTLRVPGRFEYLATARREYRTMLSGRVEVRVDEYAPVEPGTVLYTIDSPAWRALQQSIAESEAGIERLRTRLASFGPLREAHRNHEMHLQQTIAIRRERVSQLESLVAAGGGRAADLNEARGAVSIAEGELAEVLEKEAALEADEAEARANLNAAVTTRELLLESAAALLSVGVDELTGVGTGMAGGFPLWRRVGVIEVRAVEGGIVESIGMTNGAWADEKSPVVTIVRPDRVRFRGVALQSDLARLQDGQRARIVAPAPTRAAGSIDLAEVMEGTLAIGLSADPSDRTVDLIVTPDSLARWARAGVSAQMEVVTDETGERTAAIPKAAVQRDGLVPVLFRRDPADPNKAIRIEADLGIDDGRWVAVNSGLRIGDEIVLEGAYQLMLASSTAGGPQRGGHFHADGTFHAADH